MNRITYYPRWHARAHGDRRLNIAQAEALLTEWFGREVILFASGRAALLFYLKLLGWHRHSQRLIVPSYLSRCILNAVTLVAFPVKAPSRGEGLLLYHQFGWPQRYRPRRLLIIEDIAHSFFATGSTGRRAWRAPVAVFSLPKFFGLRGLAGGLVVAQRGLAARIRAALAKAEETLLPDDRARVCRLVRRAYQGIINEREHILLDGAYELLLRMARPRASDLKGLPASLEEMQRVGQERLERIQAIRSFYGQAAWPKHFWPTSETVVPFAVPYFPRTDRALRASSAALAQLAWPAAIYHIDVNRSMRHPRYRQALMLPCHQDVPLPLLREVCSVVRRYDRS